MCVDGNDWERYAKGRWPTPIYYYAVEKGGQRPPRQYNSSEPGSEDEDVAQELCHVEADDEDDDGLVEGGFPVVHDLRDLIEDCWDVLQTSQTTWEGQQQDTCIQ